MENDIKPLLESALGEQPPLGVDAATVLAAVRRRRRRRQFAGVTAAFATVGAIAAAVAITSAATGPQSAIEAARAQQPLTFAAVRQLLSGPARHTGRLASAAHSADTTEGITAASLPGVVQDITHTRLDHVGAGRADRKHGGAFVTGGIASAQDQDLGVALFGPKSLKMVPKSCKYPYGPGVDNAGYYGGKCWITSLSDGGYLLVVGDQHTLHGGYTQTFVELVHPDGSGASAGETNQVFWDKSHPAMAKRGEYWYPVSPPKVSALPPLSPSRLADLVRELDARGLAAN